LSNYTDAPVGTPKKCRKCANNCLKCNADADTCLTCKAKTYIKGTTGCADCPANCLSCDTSGNCDAAATTTTGCEAKYVLVTANTPKDC